MNDVSFELLLAASLGIVPSAFIWAIISCGDMVKFSTTNRDGVCDLDGAFDEHFDAGLEFRE